MSATAEITREPLKKKDLAADHPTWCPGCGDFSVLALYFLAMHHAGSITSAMSPSWLGFLPVMWGFLGGIAGALIGTFLSSTNQTACE